MLVGRFYIFAKEYAPWRVMDYGMVNLGSVLYIMIIYISVK